MSSLKDIVRIMRTMVQMKSLSSVDTVGTVIRMAGVIRNAHCWSLAGNDTRKVLIQSANGLDEFTYLAFN